MAIYKLFHDGIPWYLAKHYWWAYLWSYAVWFFDHQPIINAILFGQYNALMKATMKALGDAPKERVLQLTCVYGSLTPNLVEAIDPTPLHITDVAPVQLQLAQSKNNGGKPLMATRMNAEHLGYRDDAFSTVVLFFLLHEMPPEARENVLSETLRVIAPGGRLIVTEYAPLPAHHLLFRFPPSRWILTTLEPFLGGFWQDDLGGQLRTHAQSVGKDINVLSEDTCFARFYRVTTFEIS